MKTTQDKDGEMLYKALLTLKTPAECSRFLEDICTIKELQSLIQRFQVACQLDSGKNYNEVYEDTGVSSATICRVNKCLHYGSGGYRMTLERLKENGTLSGGED